MPVLEAALRKQLEKAVVKARDLAEEGARAALTRLAVHAEEPFPALTLEERLLRRKLRAKERQLGGFRALVTECAYEHWHQMLFARFLAENHLLMHSSGVPVTLAECEELAPEEGAADGWELAARYASRMLPQIFRSDDPVLEVTLAPEHQVALEKLLDELPAVMFTADDSLGWVYQFWQTKRKAEVNASEEKIGGENIGPVTQLFTEPYMVQFLLHNTLGAWWMGRHPGEPLPLEMPYLRTLEDGTPAAGTFPGWPDRAAELRIMDPCCGSGHFLVTAFEIMQRFRMVEDGLSERDAGDAVLQGNLFGLEIDPRCTQIAAFALAFAAWKRGGHRALPPLNIACSGMALRGKRDEWLALANGDQRLAEGMERLHDLFQQAPDLGSLIDPRRATEATLTSAGFAELQPLLEQALAKEKAQADDDLHFVGVAAQGIATAADLLSRQHHLVVTNVPYLLRRKQSQPLLQFIERHYGRARNDLATGLLERCLTLCATGGTLAVVTPQNWLFLGAYKAMRKGLLRSARWDLVARLGANAFETPMWDFNVAMYVLSAASPSAGHTLAGLDAQAPRIPAEKAQLLQRGEVVPRSQAAQLSNPDARVVLDEVGKGSPLGGHARSVLGFQTADYPRFGRYHWEHPLVPLGCHLHQSTVSGSTYYGGCRGLVHWEAAKAAMAGVQGAAFRGEVAWGSRGVLVSLMGDLHVTLYLGGAFDVNTAAIVPHDASCLGAIWAFCSSPEFAGEVRKIDQALAVTNATLVKVPFDLGHWQRVADEAGPLPEPYSEDPTQWLFQGHPARSTEPAQVAVARLLGYHWPEPEEDGLDAFADKDGVVCLPSVGGEQPGEERLQALLAAAYGDEWTSAKRQELLASVDFAGKSLGEWLRDGFFAQHCKLFHQRPFIWHVWDGRRDGFSALVDYHKLDHALLTRLTYTYLGDWITRQRNADQAGEGGANARLVAAQRLQGKLKLILDGEAPYDIFVRWKPLEQQPIGWQPDLNDGVRLNIRPFVEAGVLRARPNISWGKDRGKNPPGSPWGEERHNDRHLTLAEKRAAREAAGDTA